MPSSNLFSVNNLGRVFALQTDRTRWEELQYLGIDFKRVSAHDFVVWALGGDHQVYVYVYGTSVPIRVCEESFENQRWNPIEGFTSSLLPSDRPGFSSIDGLEERKLSDIHLPSLAWNWEGPWHLQDTYEGKALDKECWTYAMDFPRTFYAEKSWKSCVRRRKWVRYRRYIALDTWSAVSSIHKDHTQEPFIDIAIGGGDVVGADPDRLMVWGITAFGKVAVRTGICSTCPEGSKWVFVPTLSNQELTCVSVGRSGRVWALTWEGVALVRTGVTRDTPLGIGWVHVDPPGSSPLTQIAVGVEVVWGVCRDSSVWFRRGLDNSHHGNAPSDISDVGNAWLEMIGKLSMISVGPNDQVWGITSEENSLVIRTGVTSSELTGKTWKLIHLPCWYFDPDDRGSNPDRSSESASSSNSSSHRSSPLNKINQDSNISRIIKGSECSLNVSEDAVSMVTEDAVSMTTEAVFDSQSRNNGSTTEVHDSHENKIVEEGIEGPQGGRRNQGDTITEVQCLEGDGSPEGESQHFKTVTPSSVTNSTEENTAGNHVQTDPIPIIPSPDDPSESFGSIHIRNPDDVPDSMTSSVISDTVVNFVGSDYQVEGSLPHILKKGESPIDGESPVEKHNTDQPYGSPGSYSAGDSGARSTPNTPKPASSGGSSLNSELLIPIRGHGSLSQEEGALLGAPLLPPADFWMWVSGSGCWVQPHNMPKWFLADYSTFNRQEEPWRQDILQKLNTRRSVEIKGFSNFEEAVECPSWIVTGQCRYLFGGQWVPATLELQMVGAKRGQIQEAFLKIIYTLNAKKTTLIPCCSIVVCSLAVDLPARSVLSLFTPSHPIHPFPLLFSAEKDAEQWLSHVSSACVQFRGVDSPPSPSAIWAISSLGDIYFHDPASPETELKAETSAANCPLDIGEGMTPLLRTLERGFKPGTFISMKGRVHDDAKRFHIDLLTDESFMNLALHFNPRFNEKLTVLNSREHNVWAIEERTYLKPFGRGKECHVTILCDDVNMKISVNDKLFHCFNHRLMPYDINHVCVSGDITVTELTYNYGAGERGLCEYFWRGIGGHLRTVEAGFGGVTWGMSYDSHVYTYTGVCGGGLYKGNASDPKINVMSDVRHFYVWENMRWNPVTGFTYRGLPTDRHTWSDQSGRHARTKQGTKLPSMHWQWVGDWTVDHHTPGGVDKDGWQYATDFPMSFHGHRYVTDLVRRRRWVRKCRISTSGPWKQMEKVALISVSVSPHASDEGTVPVWGVSVSNEVVIREGVTPSKPRGTRWSLIPSEAPMKSICAGIEGGVWAVSCTGQAHLRIGVTKSNPEGTDWVNIDAPDVPLKEACIGQWQVWALDRESNLHIRTNVQPLFPEGTGWERVTGDVDTISVGADGSLWAVLHTYPPAGESVGHGDDGRKSSTPVTGVIARRKGVCQEVPGGTGWDISSGSGWSHVSARIPVLI